MGKIEGSVCQSIRTAGYILQCVQCSAFQCSASSAVEQQAVQYNSDILPPGLAAVPTIVPYTSIRGSEVWCCAVKCDTIKCGSVEC